MSSRVRKSLLFMVLVAAAAASWLLRPSPPPEDALVRTPGLSRAYYMNDAVFSGLDEQGQIIYRVAATRIEGSQDSSLLDLSDVEIRYVQDLNVPWLIRARSARTDAQRHILELTDVVIESTAGDSRETARIEARDIQLEPERRRAVTQGPVRFAIGESTINAVGLVADLEAEKFVLESDVNAQVSP